MASSAAVLKSRFVGMFLERSGPQNDERVVNSFFFVFSKFYHFRDKFLVSMVGRPGAFGPGE